MMGAYLQIDQPTLWDHIYRYLSLYDGSIATDNISLYDGSIATDISAYMMGA